MHLKIVKFKVHLNDGSTSVPECVVMLPANEANELDTVLLLGEVDYDLIFLMGCLALYFICLTLVFVLTNANKSAAINFTLHPSVWRRTR